MKYFPHTPDDLREMLAVIGVNSLDELYAEVPQELLHKGELNLPDAQSEIELRRTLRSLAEQNRPLTAFAGGGAYDHYTPSLIPYITARSEFSTSYTPYQAEISQGTLQYIFEYQTMMADLTGMDISNASMYDGATATAEAMMMCVAAAKKRNRVLISSTFAPNVLRVAETYALYHGVDLQAIPEKDGATDKDFLKAAVEEGNVAGVLLPQPNYYGIVEDFEGIADHCHAHKTLLAINAVPADLATLRSPGEWGADIACGDGQSLGLPLSCGGPYIGYLCCKEDLVRKMPGRLVGMTTDAEGRRAFVLTMQAREQHIRREKATSNICTAQGIMCLWIGAYLSLMGQKGLQEAAALSYAGAHTLRDLLTADGAFAEAFPNQPFFNEFTLKCEGVCPNQLRHAIAEKGWLAGIAAEGRKDLLILCVTEKRSREEIEAFAKELIACKNELSASSK